MGYEGRLEEVVSWIVRASGWVDVRDMEAKWASWSVSHAAMTDSEARAAEERAKVTTGGQGPGVVGNDVMDTGRWVWERQ